MSENAKMFEKCGYGSAITSAIAPRKIPLISSSSIQMLETMKDRRFFGGFQICYIREIFVGPQLRRHGGLGKLLLRIGSVKRGASLHYSELRFQNITWWIAEII